jgi:PelA/Pel-15E family pectate lyase
MFFCREMAHDPLYNFLNRAYRTWAQQAFDRGIDCILKCQIKVNGKLTAWCAQHDEKDFSPRPARTFELTSLSGSESVGIIHVLMSVDHPSPQIIDAIHAACAWFDAVKIPGIKVVDTPDKDKPHGISRVVVKDPTAPPMWARFYEIGTNKPIFADRDGVKKYDLSEIGDERRNGYRWLGHFAADLLAKDYPA